VDISRKVTPSLSVRMVAQSRPEGFIVAVRLVERRDLQGVMALLPPPPSLEEALQEVKGQVRGVRGMDLRFIHSAGS
jgi:hypothetical protein